MVTKHDLKNIILALEIMGGHLEIYIKRLEKVVLAIPFEDFEDYSDDHNSEWGGAGPDCKVRRLEAAD